MVRCFCREVLLTITATNESLIKENVLVVCLSSVFLTEDFFQLVCDEEWIVHSNLSSQESDREDVVAIIRKNSDGGSGN